MKFKNTDRKSEQDQLDLIYQKTTYIINKSNSIPDLRLDFSQYLKGVEISNILRKLKNVEIIIEKLTETYDSNCANLSFDELETMRLNYGCAIISLLEMADPYIDEDKIVFESLKKVINKYFISSLKDIDSASRKVGYYGNIRLILDKFDDALEYYLNDDADSFGLDLIKLLKDEINLILTADHSSLDKRMIIFSIVDYFNILKNLRISESTASTIENNWLSLLSFTTNSNASQLAKNEMDCLSSTVNTNILQIQQIVHYAYHYILTRYSALSSMNFNLMENKDIDDLVEELEYTIKVLDYILEHATKNKEVNSNLKRMRQSITPKTFLNFKKDFDGNLKVASENNSPTDIFETYIKYEADLQAKRPIKVDPMLFSFLAELLSNPSNIFQRKLTSDIFNTILLNQYKSAIASVDDNERVLRLFCNLHRVVFFKKILHTISTKELIQLNLVDTNRYLSTTITKTKPKATSEKKSDKNKKSKSKNKVKSKNKQTTEINQQPSNVTQNIATKKIVATPPVLSVNSDKVEVPKDRVKTNSSKSNKKKNNKTSKNKNKNKQAPDTKKNITLSVTNEIEIDSFIPEVETPADTNQELNPSHYESFNQYDANNFETIHQLSFMPQAATNHMIPILKKSYNIFMFGGAVRDILWKDLGRRNDLHYNDVDLVTDIPEYIFVSLFPYAQKSKYIDGLWQVPFAGDTKRLISVDIKLVPNLNLDEFLKDSYLAVDSLVCNVDGKILDPLRILDKFFSTDLQLVGSPEKHFSTNAERILKAIKTAAHLSAPLSAELKNAIIQYKGVLNQLDLSHLMSLLSRICLKSRDGEGFRMLVEFDLINGIFQCLGKNISRHLYVDSIAYNFMQSKFKEFYNGGSYCTKYELLSIFLVLYFEINMSSEKNYYDVEKIKIKLNDFLEQSNVKLEEKGAWQSETLQFFNKHWKDYELFEMTKKYQITDSYIPFYNTHQAPNSSSASVDAQSHNLPTRLRGIQNN